MVATLFWRTYDDDGSLPILVRLDVASSQRVNCLLDELPAHGGTSPVDTTGVTPLLCVQIQRTGVDCHQTSPR